MKPQAAAIAMALTLGMSSLACNSGDSSGPSGGGGSTGGSGGTAAGGSGGVTPSGGSSTSGGATGKGGSSASGGVTGKGGSSASGGVTGKGGTTAAGGGGGGGSTTCTDVAPCGGGVVATWTVTSSCLNVSGELDMQALFSLSCATGTVTGTLAVTGTWTAKADGTFVDDTTTTGDAQLTLPPECKILSMAPVTCDRIGSVMAGGYYDKVTCVDDPVGKGCTCTTTVKHTGSMGLVTSDPQTSGNYTTASNTITITQDDSQYSYCVSGNKLTVTPRGASATMTGVLKGTIVLQSGSSPGTGGAAGGSSGRGGTTGSGGATGGGGGRGGSGGTVATGGTTGMGGVATGGTTTGRGGAGGSGGSTNFGTRPCDIYAAANMPCGAAYSMVRSLSSTYSGPLYQVRNGSSATNTGTGGSVKDIMMLDDGYADSASQDTFCTSTCSVSKLYDQSGNGNDLIRGSGGPSGNGTRSDKDDYEAVANKISVTAGGHRVYALWVQQYGGYRTALNVTAKGVPIGNKDQGIYELVDGTHYGKPCCWDFGSVSPDPKKYVTMNTVFFGTGYWGTGAGSGPWFGGDFEGGVWMGGSSSTPGNNPNNPSMGVAFALGILHTPVGKYAIRVADVSTASDLTTAYDGNIPSGKTWGNAGGIVMGVGGDNSNNSEGTFFEGAVVNGAPSNATDLLIMKNIQAVGYKK